MGSLMQWDMALQFGALTWSDIVTALAAPSMVVVVGVAIAIGFALGNGPTNGHSF